MAVKKGKRGANVGMNAGFDATPPDDGVDISTGNNRKPMPKSVQDGQKGVKKIWQAYVAFLQNSFRNTPRYQQEAYINRFAQILCIGISAVILNSFYSILLPQVRIISLPIVIGGAWFIANKLVAPAIIKRMGDYMNRD